MQEALKPTVRIPSAFIIPSIENRFYVDALKHILDKAYYDRQDYSYVTALLNQYPQITAVISVATQTQAAQLALRELKKTIPKDIILISFDDAIFLKILGISAVAHNLEEIAVSAACKLNALLAEKGENQQPEKTILKPALVLRQSVKEIS